MQLPCFNWFREKFYTNNVKNVPNDIYILLIRIGLAYWILDDGSCEGSGIDISVYGFSEADVDKLIFTLQNKFKFRCSIHYNKDNKPRIYIFKESIDSLRNCINLFFFFYQRCYINLIYNNQN